MAEVPALHHRMPDCEERLLHGVGTVLTLRRGRLDLVEVLVRGTVAACANNFCMMVFVTFL